MGDELPYRIEYSKSGRAKCRACGSEISKDVLRIAAMVQSPMFDGKMAHWYHDRCFFNKQRPNSVNDIGNFDCIKWEDQEKIKKKIEECANLPLPAAKKGRKRASTSAKGGADGDFKVEYAKSGKAMCRGCEDKIPKGEVRVSKKDFESEEARRYGGLDRWYHLKCFAQLRKDLRYFAAGDALPGITSLSPEDKKLVKDSLPKIDEENAPPAVKKIKEDPEDIELEKKIKKQNERLFKARDQLSMFPKTVLTELLVANGQEVPTGTSSILDHLSDVICFGALEPCEKCKGQLHYMSGIGYRCTGQLEEWVKCEHVTPDPKRKKFKVPSDHADSEIAAVIKKVKPRVEKRLFKLAPPTTSAFVKKEDEVDSGPKIQAGPRPLKHMQFFILGRTTKDKEILKKEINALGGDVVSRIHDKVAAVISTPKEVEKMGKRMEEAKELDIDVVSEDFVEEAKEYTDPPILLIKNKSICGWGGDPSVRVNKSITEKSAGKSKSKFEKSSSGKVKLQVKGGGTVDPDSGLEDRAHVFQKGKEKYTVTLGLTDIQSGKNSYYKLQILKHDKRNEYWLFRSWGRIGTTIGGNKLESLSLEECIEQFEGLFEDKSGNAWKHKDQFVKRPGKMYMLDIDHGFNENDGKLFESDIPSNLKKPVQDLIRLIFDVETMKKVMLEFEIDMDKMPLGKLSKRQLQDAYSILTELQNAIKQGNADRAVFIGASNKFYTLIPHNFGIDGPKILEQEKDIQEKCAMLDSLLEMEVAYNLLHTKTDGTKNPLDAHYEQLHTDIDVLDKESEEYKNIEKYVKNTHAPTHSSYDLVIEDVFVIKRQGEDKRYKPFKKLPNRKLLWHGSRTTNFAGILSQGLRIAPPEAPVTGYMFGKGIYFADMVSKSANYCCTNSQNPTGLLLLSEVALGNMYERYRADYIEKLPKGKHSVKGVGQTCPDPTISLLTEDGVEIPYGPPVKANLPTRSDLLYNEYIVYDVAQVKAKYLLKIDFKYKY